MKDTDMIQLELDLLNDEFETSPTTELAVMIAYYTALLLDEERLEREAY